MIALDLIKQIESAGGSINSQGGRLTIEAPPAVLNEAVLLKIRQEKDKILKTLELQKLIKEVSWAYGGDDQKFLAEYLHDLLSNNDIDQALVCFQDLVKQTQIRR